MTRTKLLLLVAMTTLVIGAMGILHAGRGSSGLATGDDSVAFADSSKPVEVWTERREPASSTTTTTVPAPPPPPTTAAPAPKPKPKPKPTPTTSPPAKPGDVATGANSSFRACVAWRESGNNYASVGGGMYGIIPPTMRSMGYAQKFGTDKSWLVSPAGQDWMFNDLYSKMGKAPWSPYDGC